MFAVLILAGCGNQPVALSYAGADPQLTTAGTVNGAKKIYLEPFGDKRPVKDDIGDLVNGYGMKMGEVVLTNDAGETVTNAIKQELEQSGYQVVDAASGTQPDDAPTLAGDIVELDCCSKGFTDLKSQISLDVVLTDNGTEKVNRIYAGEGSKHGLFYTQSSYEAAMSRALENALEQLITDIDAQAS
jgi:hypothetical protein